MSKVLVAGRIPAEQAIQLKKIEAETGKSESEVVREAIAQYLGKTAPDSVASMSRRLSRLERQYTKLVQLS